MDTLRVNAVHGAMLPQSKLSARGATFEKYAFAGLALILTLLAVRSYRFAGNDYRVFRTAGERFLHGTGLYQAVDGFYAYRYAPGISALFAPLSGVPYAAGKAIWLASIVLSLLATTVLLHRRLRGAAWYAAPLALVAVLRLVFDEMQHVQVNALTLALVVGALALEDEGREISGGVLLSIAIALKVAPIFVALDWILRRRWRALSGIALGLAGITLLPILTYGVSGAVNEHLAWVRSELRWSGSVLTLPRNQSVWSLMGRLGFGRAGGALAALAVLGAALSTRDRDLRRALMVLAVPLASAYGWLQNFIFAVPLTALLLARYRRLGWLAFALAASTVVPSYDVVGRRWEQWALEHTAVGLSMLGLFVVGRWAAQAQVETTSTTKPSALESPRTA